MQEEICQSSTGIGYCNEIGAIDNRREKLNSEIEFGIEYVLQTIGSNERITLPLIKYNAGKIYGGEWKNGMNDGKGRLEWPDGSVYEGDFAENVYSGWGKLIQANGDIYDGEWKNDQANGKGTYVLTIGAKYEGEVQNKPIIINLKISQFEEKRKRIFVKKQNFDNLISRLLTYGE